MRARILSTALLALLLTTLASWAQDDKAQEALDLRTLLEDDRHAFETKRNEVTLAANRLFIERLRGFESRAAVAEDFTRAMVYRDRRLTLIEDITRHNPKRIEQREASAIALSPSEAALTGSVTLKRDILQGWKTTATAATWSLRGLQPGRYEVCVTYSCSKAYEEKDSGGAKKIRLRSGGQFTLGETTRLVGGDRTQLRHQVQPTKDWLSFRTVSLGELTLSNAAVRLRLDVDEVKPLGLMHLKEMKLYPTQNETATKPLPNLAELRRSFQATVDRRLTHLRTLYKADLKALETKALAQGDKALASEIQHAHEKINP